MIWATIEWIFRVIDSQESPTCSEPANKVRTSTPVSTKHLTKNPLLTENVPFQWLHIFNLEIRNSVSTKTLLYNRIERMCVCHKLYKKQRVITQILAFFACVEDLYIYIYIYTHLNIYLFSSLFPNWIRGDLQYDLISLCAWRWTFGACCCGRSRGDRWNTRWHNSY